MLNEDIKVIHDKESPYYTKVVGHNITFNIPPGPDLIKEIENAKEIIRARMVKSLGQTLLMELNNVSK